MIKKPAKTNSLLAELLEHISKKQPEKLGKYLEYHQPVDNKGRYLPFDEYRYRVANDLEPDLAWALTKAARAAQHTLLLPLGDDKTVCTFMLTRRIHTAISHVDRHATTAALEWMGSKIGEGSHFEYLLNDLIEDEAISSSQLEGAATTTLIAKEMLKRKRKPRTPDEKMILGNFKMMKFAWDNRNKPLSVALILAMHREGTKGINNDNYSPGAFRQTDDVVVVDAQGETVHTPPSADAIEQRLNEVVRWANTHHHDADSNTYIHPMIKAICLHFSIGFEHPFRDGNGRVARSLFYWYMFKNEYAAFRYIAISTLLKSAPVKYGKSYLYSETDGMDLTYFIEYQCSVIVRAINSFNDAYIKSIKDIQRFNNWIDDSDLHEKLSDKQKVIYQLAKSGTEKNFTATNVKENLDCSYNTAASALNGLVEMSIFSKKKEGREWVYCLAEEVIT